MSLVAPPAASVWDGHVDVAARANGSGIPSIRASALPARWRCGPRPRASGWSAPACTHRGDHLRVELDVGPDAALTMRSISATLARASTPPLEFAAWRSRPPWTGGTLRWAPAPGIAGAGSVHRCDARISLQPTSVLTWSDAVAWAAPARRSGPGRASSVWRSTGVPCWTVPWRSGCISRHGRRRPYSTAPAAPRVSSWSSPAIGHRRLWPMCVRNPRCFRPHGAPVRLCGAAVSWGASLSGGTGARRALARHPLLSAWQDPVVQDHEDVVGTPLGSERVLRP